MPFPLEVICASRIHCPTCRDQGLAGRRWREDLRPNLSPEVDGPDWICPHDVAWHGTPLTLEDRATLESLAAAQRELVERQKQALILAGRAHWLALHSFDHVPSPAEFAAWLEAVPSFGCSCKRDFDAIMADDQPDFSSLPAFRRWGHRVHNTVNVNLKKATVEYAEAAALYGW